jgi:hypothetical protein
MTSPSSVIWKINDPQVVHEILDGEVVVINLHTGSYYSLDGVGTDVWTLIETSTDTDEIVRDISRRYDGSHSEIEEAVVRLIDELRQEGLIMSDGTRAVEVSTNPTQPDEARPEKRAFKTPALRKYTDMEELITLDPIHQVDDTGWPNPQPGRTTAG